MTKWWFFLALILSVGIITACSDDDDEDLEEVTLLSRNGGRVDWSATNGLIAFDRLEGGRFDVHTMLPDGTYQECITCDVAGLPPTNRGQPAWHPNGRHMVIQALKEEGGIDDLAYSRDPGAGVGCDLWLVDTETGNAELLWEVAPGPDTGVLHPHFSHDGTQLSWSQLYSAPLTLGFLLGKWRLMVADFDLDDGHGKLSAAHEIPAGPEGFYENHGFDIDGRSIVFSGNIENPKDLLRLNIYRFDFSTEEVTLLASEGFNEHAIISPDGKTIIWESSRSLGETLTEAGAEYWLMDINGENKRQLTYFNDLNQPSPLHVEDGNHNPPIFVPSDVTWSPDGKTIIGFVQVVGEGMELFTGTPDKWNVRVEIPEELR